MKFFTLFFMAFLAASMGACTHRESKKGFTHEDSLRIQSDKAFQLQLAQLQNVREELTGPSDSGDPAVTQGDMFESALMDDSTKAVTRGFENLKARMERAQKDSTTAYGALLTRFRLLNTQHKYLTATYTNEARLLRYTSEISFDNRHEEDRDFYFSNGKLIYFRERHTFTRDEQNLMNDDSYLIKDGKVVYSYRDQGSAQEVRDRMNVMSLRRYRLKGNLAAHVASELANFKSDYEILLNQPLESLIYPSSGKPQ